MIVGSRPRKNKAEDIIPSALSYAEEGTIQGLGVGGRHVRPQLPVADVAALLRPQARGLKSHVGFHLLRRAERKHRLPVDIPQEADLPREGLPQPLQSDGRRLRVQDVGAKLDQKLAPQAHRVTIDMPRFGFSTAEAAERGRDVETLRGFVAGQ